MNNTYTSEMPYSESLQHYGVQGMKWGIRRYQNKDGTRTSLGKKRYRKGGDLYKPVSGNHEEAAGIKNAPRRLAEGIVRGVKQKLAERMPFMLNDEEVQRYTDRQRSENAYLNARADKRITKQKGKQENYGVTLLKNAANKAMGIAVDKTMNKTMERLLETADEKALREAKTEKSRYEEESKAAINRLANTISSNDEANENDSKQLSNNVEKAQKIVDRMNTRTEKSKTANAANRSRLRAQNVADLAKLKLLTKDSRAIRKTMDLRDEETSKAIKSLTSKGFEMYQTGKNNNSKGVTDDDILRVLNKVLNTDR